MRISDWSSDVCSSDLPAHPPVTYRRCSRAIILRRRHSLSLAEFMPVSPSAIGPDLDRAAHRLFRLVSLLAAFLHRLAVAIDERRSEEHTSELQSLMRISYAVFCLKKKNKLEGLMITKNHKAQ